MTQGDAVGGLPSDPRSAVELIARADLDGARSSPMRCEPRRSPARACRRRRARRWTLETRGAGHTEELLAALERAGYEVRSA